MAQLKWPLHHPDSSGWSGGPSAQFEDSRGHSVGEAHLDVIVGWDEDIVDAVDAMFMAYERSHGLL